MRLEEATGHNTGHIIGCDKKDESVAVAVRRVILVFIVGRIVIVVAVTGRSAAVIIAPISIESELETTMNAFVITFLKLAVGTVIFGSVEYGTWR